MLLERLESRVITGHVFIATSLDGFVARPDHQLDWLTSIDTRGQDMGYDTFMASVDGIVMGRGSFETVCGFPEWPYKKPVVVMSRSLTDADLPEALRGRVRLSRLEPAAVMQMLEDEGWSRVYVDGGALVQSFLRDGLIADLIVTTAPVLIGAGKRLFGALNEDMMLETSSVTQFECGMVQTHYRVRA